MKPDWSKFCQNPTERHVSKIFGISYQSPIGQHVLCTGLYEYQADWLIAILQKVKDTPQFHG